MGLPSRGEPHLSGTLLPRLEEDKFSDLSSESFHVPTPQLLQCATGFEIPNLPIFLDSSWPRNASKVSWEE